MAKRKTNGKIQGVINNINWDNWKVGEEESYKGKSKDGYYDLTEVMSNRIDWIISDNNLEGEHLEALQDLKIMLEVLTEEDLLKLEDEINKRSRKCKTK